jgi:hypothetical protein
MKQYLDTVVNIAFAIRKIVITFWWIECCVENDDLAITPIYLSNKD